MSSKIQLANVSAAAADSESRGDDHGRAGVLIVNADDWGRDRETTERILQCVRCESVSSVSAMVFMEDSERAAAIAQETGIDGGLHLNLTTPFSAPECPPRLLQRQQVLSRFLLRHPLARMVFCPWLVRDFEYVVAAQFDEFRRLYGIEPTRIDGHHHAHLCANLLFGKLLPADTLVRRNFSFQPGEKSFYNRLYRKTVDGILARRHRLVDFLFALPPLEAQGRLRRIFSLARQFVVEVETHPINPEEYRYLTGGEILRQTRECAIASRFTLSSPGRQKLQKPGPSPRAGRLPGSTKLQPWSGNRIRT